MTSRGISWDSHRATWYNRLQSPWVLSASLLKHHSKIYKQIILKYVGRDSSVGMIYLLTAIGLSHGGSSTVHIYTQTIHRTIRNKQYIEQHNNFGRVRAVPPLG